MAAAAGIFNHSMTAGQALTGSAVAPMDSPTNGTSGTSDSSSSSDSATISANDFLTLLVTEMQNQDPTADTDPNEYIDQLVQVNSLEQLIDINQTLTTGLGSGTTSSTSDGSSSQIAGAAAPASAQGSGSATSQTTSAEHSRAASYSTLWGKPGVNTASSLSDKVTEGKHGAGNLSIPGEVPSARRVGHALAGRTHAAQNTAGINTTPAK